MKNPYIIGTLYIWANDFDRQAQYLRDQAVHHEDDTAIKMNLMDAANSLDNAQGDLRRVVESLGGVEAWNLAAENGA